MSDSKRMARALKDDAGPVLAFWAVGLNFDYDLLYCEKPNPCDWGSLEGPFKTLGKAKRQVREWIAGDRADLARTLDEVNRLTLKQVRGTK